MTVSLVGTSCAVEYGSDAVSLGSVVALGVSMIVWLMVRLVAGVISPPGGARAGRPATVWSRSSSDSSVLCFISSLATS